MPDQPRNEAALADWEGEGGSVRAAPREVRARGYVPCLPSLPSGYGFQPAWGFRRGRYFYEFHRVYGSPDVLDKRGPTCPLDENLSYWVVTWSRFTETGDEQPAGRWMSYAQARKLRGTRLTFARFSSLVRMRAALPELLCVGDLPMEPHPTVSPDWHAGASWRQGEAAGAENADLHPQVPRPAATPRPAVAHDTAGMRGEP